MKSDSLNKVKLGIFVSAGVTLFCIGIFFIGETKKLFSTTFRITSVFENVNGLQVGNNVRFAGINVGTIGDIQIITDTSVRVDMIIDTKVQQFIRKDAKAIIGSDGLMGNRIMNISPGTNSALQIANNDIIVGIAPPGMDDMLLKLKATADHSASITSDLADIMHRIKSGKGTIGKLFMDTVFADNLDKTIRNVKQGTKGFSENMDAARNSFLLRGYFRNKKLPAAVKKK
jgi:phospholipid/cholesterol/gamma-HCH transport system substrate-binding protein